MRISAVVKISFWLLVAAATGFILAGIWTEEELWREIGLVIGIIDALYYLIIAVFVRRTN